MLNIIVAPKAQNKKAENVAKSIIKLLKADKKEYSVYFSIDNNNMIDNINELQSLGENEFIVVGDDRTINVLVNTIKDIGKIKLGIIPTGKHNDFANYLGISTRPALALKDVLSSNIENVDILLVNEQRVLNSVIIGASVEVEEKFSQYKIKNLLSEQVARSKYGNTYSGVDLVLISKNAKQRKTTAFELVVANGGLSKKKNVSPLSNMQDGMFNLLYCDIADKKTNSKYISKLNKGEHIYDENTYQYWMNDLTITSPDKHIKASLDGRIVTVEQLNITLVENALKIMKSKN